MKNNRKNCFTWSWCVRETDVVTGYCVNSYTTFQNAMPVRTVNTVEMMIQHPLRNPDEASPALLTPLMLVLCQKASHVCQRTWHALLCLIVSFDILGLPILLMLKYFISSIMFVIIRHTVWVNCEICKNNGMCCVDIFLKYRFGIYLPKYTDNVYNACLTGYFLKGLV